MLLHYMPNNCYCNFLYMMHRYASWYVICEYSFPWTSFYFILSEYISCVVSCFAIIVSYLVIAILTSIAWYIDMRMSYYHHYMPNNCYHAFNTWCVIMRVDIWYASTFLLLLHDLLILLWLLLHDTWYMTLVLNMIIT